MIKALLFDVFGTVVDWRSEEAILFISRNSCQKQPEEIRKGKNIFGKTIF